MLETRKCAEHHMDWVSRNPFYIRSRCLWNSRSGQFVCNFAHDATFSSWTVANLMLSSFVGNAVPGCWFANGWELYCWIQQLRLCLWTGLFQPHVSFMVSRSFYVFLPLKFSVVDRLEVAKHTLCLAKSVIWKLDPVHIGAWHHAFLSSYSRELER